MRPKAVRLNIDNTRSASGFVGFTDANPKDYLRIGFKSGLEIHQQLHTGGKLFCRCPAGRYQDDEDFNAEIIRHMRPTLSELGEYDGTALMEFKTRKEITYRIHNATACTYEVDDTPPFPIDEEALDIALRIALLCKLNIVGEVHITRKQYLDGSIPTGFQRTAILGVEGEIQLRNKTVRLIQLSIEEDSCREVSDIGHRRVYKTDRLGMPLIETVTYPDLETPQELAEAAETIRFLNRSTGLVRTGMGAGREDVNVSCAGGTRVEIKGVAHNSWIPRLAHNEAFRQAALLHIRATLRERSLLPDAWAMHHRTIDYTTPDLLAPRLRRLLDQDLTITVINLPGLEGILSHFTQPGKIFADELSDRLKVIACIEKPNLCHSEELQPRLQEKTWKALRAYVGAAVGDAQLVVWGPAEDIPTALETVEERIRMVWEGVPPETRKSLPDGTTLFERVLPGSDRMYPDTDSAPIPLSEERIARLGRDLPTLISERYKQLAEWGIPEDTWNYLLSHNLLPLLERVVADFGYGEREIGIFLGQVLKHVEGQQPVHKGFSQEKIYELLRYLRERKLHFSLAPIMLPVIYEFPDMQFSSILTTVNYRRRSLDEILSDVEFLYHKFIEIARKPEPAKALNWIMGELRPQIIGNLDPAGVHEILAKRLQEYEGKA